MRQSDCTLHENRNHRSLKPFRCIYPGCNRCYATKYELSRHVHTHGSFDILRVCGNKERRQTHIGLRTCTFHNTLKTHDTRCPSNNGTPVRTTGEENEEVAHSRQYQRHASGSPAFLRCTGLPRVLQSVLPLPRTTDQFHQRQPPPSESLPSPSSPPVSAAWTDL